MTDEVTATDELFDLATLDTVAGSDQGVEIELKHPVTKKPLGLFVGVYGKHGSIFQEIVRDRSDARVAKDIAARKRGEMNDEIITAAQSEARAIELLVACTFSWRSEVRKPNGEVVSNKPVFKFKGQELGFTIQNVKMVYEKIIWLREQVDTEIGNLANFIPA